MLYRYLRSVQELLDHGREELRQKEARKRRPAHQARMRRSPSARGPELGSLAAQRISRRADAMRTREQQLMQRASTLARKWNGVDAPTEPPPSGTAVAPRAGSNDPFDVPDPFAPQKSDDGMVELLLMESPKTIGMLAVNHFDPGLTRHAQARNFMLQFRDSVKCVYVQVDGEAIKLNLPKDVTVRRKGQRAILQGDDRAHFDL